MSRDVHPSILARYRDINLCPFWLHPYRTGFQRYTLDPDTEQGLFPLLLGVGCPCEECVVDHGYVDEDKPSPREFAATVATWNLGNVKAR